MPEYFIVANSFAAPIVSDQGTAFITADTPQMGLELYVERYAHPAGLYAAAIYASADAYHKNHEPLAKWLSSKALADTSESGGVVILAP